MAVLSKKHDEEAGKNYARKHRSHQQSNSLPTLFLSAGRRIALSGQSEQKRNGLVSASRVTTWGYRFTLQFAVRRSRIVLGLLCLVVICITLSLGLWPFHTPLNQVSWQQDGNGLLFGGSGTVLCNGIVHLTKSPQEVSFSVEIKFKPTNPFDSGTLLAFYSPTNPLSFALRQTDFGAELITEEIDDRGRKRLQHRRVDYFPRRPRPVLMTLACGRQGMTAYLDGAPVKTLPGFWPFPKGFVGQFVVGDAPGQSDAWSGLILGLAMYNEELSPSQVLRHYHAWTSRGMPEAAENEGAVALYLFNERQGSVVHNRIQPGIDLHIPEKYVVVNKITLEPFWEEFEWSRSYWGGSGQECSWFHSPRPLLLSLSGDECSKQDCGDYHRSSGNRCQSDDRSSSSFPSHAGFGHH